MFLELRWLDMEYTLSSKGGRPSHPVGVPVVVVVGNIPGLFRDVEGAKMSTNPSQVLPTTQLRTRVVTLKIQTQRAKAIAAAASDEDGKGFRIGTCALKQERLLRDLLSLWYTQTVCATSNGPHTLLLPGTCVMYVWTDVVVTDTKTLHQCSNFRGLLSVVELSVESVSAENHQAVDVWVPVNKYLEHIFNRSNSKSTRAQLWLLRPSASALRRSILR